MASQNSAERNKQTLVTRPQSIFVECMKMQSGVLPQYDHDNNNVCNKTIREDPRKCV